MERQDVESEKHQGRHDVRHDEACEIGSAREWDEQGDQNQKSRHGAAAVEAAKDEEQPGEHQRLREHRVPNEPVHMREQQEQAVEGASVELRRENQIIAGIRVEEGKPIQKRWNEEGERRDRNGRDTGQRPVSRRLAELALAFGRGKPFPRMEGRRGGDSGRSGQGHWLVNMRQNLHFETLSTR